MRRLVLPALLAVVLVASACSGGSTKSASSAPTSKGVSTTKSAPASSTVPAPPQDVPAGVQFAAGALLPPGFVPNSGVATNGKATVLAGGIVASLVRRPAIVVSVDNTTWERVLLDATSYSPPKGFPTNLSGFHTLRVAGGPSGFVVIGSATWAQNSGFADQTRVDFVWQSTDGHSWRLVDLRPLLGGGSQAIRLDNAQFLAGQFVLTGAVSALNIHSGPSKGLVLTSSDGVTWKALGTPKSSWATELSQAMQVGGRLVIAGTEYICSSNAVAFVNPVFGTQQRLWSSADSGQTWIAATIPAEILGGAKPPPADAAGCPAEGSSVGPPTAIFNQSIGLVGAAGDSVVAWSEDHTIAAVSTDLVAWSTASVPGGKPSGHPLAGSQSALASVDKGAPLLISLEDRRDTDDSQMNDRGSQTIAWRFADGAWRRLVAGRPVILQGFGSLAIFGNSVWLSDSPRAQFDESVTRISVSDAGPLKPFGSCEPAAHANCAFASVGSADLHRRDLTGIDLSGASIAHLDLTGAMLDHAKLSNSLMLGVKFTNAKMTSVVAENANFGSSDLTGVDFTSADLRGSWVPVSLFAARSLYGTSLENITIRFAKGDTMANVSLAGMDLSGSSFFGSVTTVPMRGANLRETNLSTASFYGIDLTGVDFSLAVITNTSFGLGTICPDGAPPTAASFGPAACRL